MGFHLKKREKYRRKLKLFKYARCFQMGTFSPPKWDHSFIFFFREENGIAFENCFHGKWEGKRKPFM